MKTLVRPALRPVAATAKNGVSAFSGRSLRSSNNGNLVTTATLQRGRVYFYAGVPFSRGVETAIDADFLKKYNVDARPEEFAEKLSDLFEEVVDSDQERFAKPIFEVRYNRPRPKTQKEIDAEERPRRVRQFVNWDDQRQEQQSRHGRTPGRISRV